MLRIFFLLTITFLSSTLSAQEMNKKWAAAVNSAVDEQNLVFTPDESTVYFVRSRHINNVGGKKDLGDIWVSEILEKGGLSEPQNIGKPLNNKLDNRLLGFSPDGNTMYLHHHYLESGKRPNTDGLSYATRTNNGWSFPLPLEIPYFSNNSEHQSGYIHPGGKIMVLSLESFATRGAEDIYVLFRNGEYEWTEPLNLGNAVNTSLQELSPYLSADTRTLYFSSNGQNRDKGRDVYRSTRLDDSWRNWSEPVRLSDPVNTNGIEMYYQIYNDNQYVVTTQNSNGLGDIQQFTYPDKVVEDTVTSVNIPLARNFEQVVSEREEVIKNVVFYGKLLSSKDSSSINGARTLLLADNDTIAIEEGAAYRFSLNPDDSYIMQVQAAGFLNKKFILDAFNNRVQQKDLYLTAAEVGSTVKLDNVIFERGKAVIRKVSYPQLNEVFSFLNDNPNISIQVSGHTDNVGKPMLNLILSEDRARAVKNYLVKKGINEGRIAEKGFGGKQPIAPNDTEANKRKNRRVEFTIIRNKEK